MAITERTISVGGPWAQSAKAAAAALTTALAGANNDLTFTAKTTDATGNSTTVAYVVAGNDTALSVGVVGSAITVNVATDSGGAATSTATQVRTAVNASTPASALVTASLAAGNDGSGVVDALAATPLAGGVSRRVARGGSFGATRRSNARKGQLSTS
jgi:VCBS repeat-containing protein